MPGCRERPAHAAARAPRGADTAHPAGDRAAAAWDDAHLDGLFTYCLSLMGEHAAAPAALGEALAQAERRHERGRPPADPALLRPWLYALARWSCLRRLGAGDGRAAARTVPRAAGEDAAQRRRELAALGWPEAAGATAGQREALELAVRHQLTRREVARVLRVPEQTARTLLADGAREVERTRAALAAVSAASCPAAAALSGDDPGLLLGPGLRRELLRHVAECPSCRLIAQRALAGADGAGAAAGASRLAVLPAPRAAVHAATLAVRRARAQHAPRYDRSGFPVTDRDRAARRERLRGRVVTTTVVAAALAAPALALWAAYRAAPVIGEAAGRDDPAAAAAEDGEYRADVVREYPYENAGRAEPDPSGADDAPGGEERDGSEEADGERAGEDGDRDRSGEGQDQDGAVADGVGVDSGGAERPAPGRLAVDAVPTESGSRITLTASGDEPVRWSAATDADWLTLNQTSGTLNPGETAVIMVTVDHAREPSGPWQGRITIDPAAAVIPAEGPGPADAGPSEPPPPEPAPPDPPPAGEPPAPGPDPAEV
ncbi:BACON domain-containing protein [Streptomyces specialis]|uniref:BACON domain-containing protein n=1 Tax=Streptomyces specialis TaxID=498367 RepID=UPI00073ED269|nr:sigma-70 family RNA polymerase sigma factor [Streptomyces specialis]